MELTITLFPLNDARFFTKEELNDDDPNNNIEQAWLALVSSSNDFQMTFAFELWLVSFCG